MDEEWKSPDGRHRFVIPFDTSFEFYDGGKLIVKGTLPQPPLDVHVLTGGTGVVLFEKYGNWGFGNALALLAADGKLAPGAVWRQESIVGSIFEAQYRTVEGGVIPTITGRAFINGELRLVIDGDDPFRFGIGAASIH